MRKTKEKGITLIALIITIIVMLILVGVTVNVALNGGLFSTAKTAVNETQIELDRDLLLSAVVGAIGSNGEVDFSVLDRNLPEGFTGSNGTYTSKKGNKFKVNKNGTITYIEDGNEQETEDEDLALLEEYCLGKGIGDVLQEAEPLKFKNNDIIPNAENELVILNYYGDDNNTHMYLETKYNNKMYNITIKIKDETGTFNKVELKYEPKGREGQTVEYDSNNDGTTEEWIILYDNGDNVEMVSKVNMGETIEFGRGDIQTQGNSGLEKTIYSYNHAIEKLNNYCASLITNENKISVRSVGSNPNDPSSEGDMYTSENLSKWVNGEYNGVGKSGDENAEEDRIRMLCHGCISTGESYFMASRLVKEDANTVSFDIKRVYSDSFEDGSYSSGNLWFVTQSGARDSNAGLLGRVRPVVKVSLDQISE